MKAILSLVCFCFAIAFWYFLLKYGGREKIRAVDTAATLTAHADPDTGYTVILKHGCAACHEIPGIPGARGKIGPTLADFRERALIAGIMANSAGNLVAWIQHPRSLDPKTAMPDLGLTEDEARAAAAYLYALPR